MGIMGKSNDNTQQSLYKEPIKRPNRYDKLSQHEIDYIWEVFNKEHDNAINRIAELTGYTKHIVNRVFEDKTNTKGPCELSRERYRHPFHESKYRIPKRVEEYIYNNPTYRVRYKNLDVEYYILQVVNWNEVRDDVQRTDRGWMATLRKFMDSDLKAKKAVHKEVKLKSRRNF